MLDLHATPIQPEPINIRLMEGQYPALKHGPAGGCQHCRLLGIPEVPCLHVLGIMGDWCDPPFAGYRIDLCGIQAQPEDTEGVFELPMLGLGVTTRLLVYRTQVTYKGSGWVVDQRWHPIDGISESITALQHCDLTPAEMERARQGLMLLRSMAPHINATGVI